MKPNCIFIVFGKEVNNNLSNVKSIATKVVPNIGETITMQRELYRVIDKNINYSSVEDYDIDEEGRGKETIWIFVR